MKAKNPFGPPSDLSPRRSKDKKRKASQKDLRNSKKSQTLRLEFNQKMEQIQSHLAMLPEDVFRLVLRDLFSDGTFISLMGTSKHLHSKLSPFIKWVDPQEALKAVPTSFQEMVSWDEGKTYNTLQFRMDPNGHFHASHTLVDAKGVWTLARHNGVTYLRFGPTKEPFFCLDGPLSYFQTGPNKLSLSGSRRTSTETKILNGRILESFLVDAYLERLSQG